MPEEEIQAIIEKQNKLKEEILAQEKAEQEQKILFKESNETTEEKVKEVTKPVVEVQVQEPILVEENGPPEVVIEQKQEVVEVEMEQVDEIKENVSPIFGETVKNEIKSALENEQKEVIEVEDKTDSVEELSQGPQEPSQD